MKPPGIDSRRAELDFMEPVVDAQRTLVIGYGNELRGDDAAGPSVARAVEELNLPNVDVIIRQQLTPELADLISMAAAVLFVDASIDCAEVQVRELSPAPGSTLIAHSNSPEVMLALARIVFGRCPPAWLITVPAPELGFRTSLSDAATRGVATAIDRAVLLVSSHSS